MECKLNMTAAEVTAMFADPAWATRFPPILSVDQVADLLRIPKQTVYDWSSRGLLKGIKFPVGKHRRFLRDRLVLKLCNGGLLDER